MIKNKNIKIQPLKNLDFNDLKNLVVGYTSDSKYLIEYAESENSISFELKLSTIDEPFIKKYDPVNEKTFLQYKDILANGFSFGAYDGDLLVGLIIAETEDWNKSIWVWEFHVLKKYQNMGIGKSLIKQVIDKSRSSKFRTIICETQNTNSIAIIVYRKLGFRIEGIDISYYSNNDYPDNEIAIFLKYQIR